MLDAKHGRRGVGMQVLVIVCAIVVAGVMVWLAWTAITQQQALHEHAAVDKVAVDTDVIDAIDARIAVEDYDTAVTLARQTLLNNPSQSSRDALHRALLAQPVASQPTLITMPALQDESTVTYVGFCPLENLLIAVHGNGIVEVYDTSRHSWKTAFDSQIDHADYAVCGTLNNSIAVTSRSGEKNQLTVWDLYNDDSKIMQLPLSGRPWKLEVDGWNNTLDVFYRGGGGIAAPTPQTIDMVTGEKQEHEYALVSPDAHKGIRWEMNEYSVTGYVSDMEFPEITGEFEAMPTPEFRYNYGISYAQFSPDSTRMLTEPWGKLWSTYDWVVINRLEGDLFTFSPEGRWIAGVVRGTLKVYDAMTGAHHLSLPNAADGEPQFHPSGNYVMTTGGCMVQVWDILTGEKVFVIGRESDCKAVAMFSESGDKLLVSEDNGSISLYDISLLTHPTTRQALEAALVGQHSGPVYDVEVVLGEVPVVMSVGRDSMAYLYAMNDILFPQRIWTMAGVQDAAISVNGQRIALLQSDYRVNVFNTDALDQPVAQLTVDGSSGEHPATVVALSDSGQYVAAGGQRRNVSLWDIDTGTSLPVPLMGQAGEIRALEFNGDQLSVTGGVPFVWGTQGMVGMTTAIGIAGDDNWSYLQADGVTALPQGDAVVGGSVYAAAVWVDDVENEAMMVVDHKIESAVGPVSRDSVLPNGDVIVGGPSRISPHIADGTYGYAQSCALVWNTVSKQEVAHLCDHELGVYVAAYSPDGSLAVTADGAGKVYLWETDGYTLYASFQAHGYGAVLDVAFNPDGSWLVTGGEDGTVRLFAVTDTLLLELADMRGGE